MSPGSDGYGYLDVAIVGFQISQQYPKTNFGDAGFAVSASPAKTLPGCLAKSPPPADDAFKTKTTINGTDFYFAKGDDNGCGNIYEFKIYRTLSAGRTCIEISETIHTHNIGNFDPGTVKEVDEKSIWKTLDQMIKSPQRSDSQNSRLFELATGRDRPRLLRINVTETISLIQSR